MKLVLNIVIPILDFVGLLIIIKSVQIPFQLIY